MHPSAKERQFYEKFFTLDRLVKLEKRVLPARIELVAERICEMKGETGDSAVILCIQDLYGFYTWYGLSPKIVFKAHDVRYREVVEEEKLQLEVIEAVVFLQLRSLAIHLHSQDEFRYSLPEWILTESRQRRYRTAALHGDLELIKGLLAKDPMELKDYRWDLIGPSNLRRHAEIFDLAWNSSKVFDISGILKGDYMFLETELRMTAFPEHYKRMAAIFGPEHVVFNRSSETISSRLDYSARRGFLEMVRYFLDQGACLNDPEARIFNVQEKDEPLLRAVQYGPTDLEYGKMGNDAMVALLLECGADPNWYPPEKSPLAAAVSMNRFSMVRMLVEYRANVNEGYPPPIALAVRNENTETFRYLLKRGARLDTAESGPWAMAFAKLYGLESMVDILVQEGVDETALFQRVARRHEMRGYGYH